MQKPENTFIASVHKYLPKSVYHEKMANPYRGGTPDVWYSGNLRDVWIEYKFLPKTPKADGPEHELKIALTALQLQWLRARYREGRRVMIIVGCPDGGIIITGGELAKAFTITNREFWKHCMSRKELAAQIASITTEDVCA